MSFIDELENMPSNLRYEITFRALAEIVKSGTLIMVRLSEIADRLDGIARRLDAGSWEKAINAELKRRKKERASSG